MMSVMKVMVGVLYQQLKLTMMMVMAMAILWKEKNLNDLNTQMIPVLSFQIL